MKITDHIGIFEKGLPLNVCEAVIQSFNLWEGQREFIADAFKDGENQVFKCIREEENNENS